MAEQKHTGKDGAQYTFRRLTRSQVGRIHQAAGIRVGDDRVNLGGLMIAQELIFRAAVTGAESVRGADGAAVPFRLVPHGDLGRIACVEVYDAADLEDVKAVCNAAAEGVIVLSEEQRGN